MSRAIDGTKRKNRRVKLLKLAKGFKGDRKSNYKAAKDAVVKALDHSYSGSVITADFGLHVLTLLSAQKESLTAALLTVFQKPV